VTAAVLRSRTAHRPRGGALGTVVLAGALVLLALVLLDGAFPWRLITVDTGSMHPAVPAGSVVVERLEPTSAVQVGQVVTYLPPGRDEELTHRVVQRAWNGDGQLTFRTRGDANPGEDPWQAIAVEPRIWVVAGHVPALGGVLAVLRGTVAQPAVLVLLALAALAAVWAVRIGRRSSRRRASSAQRGRRRAGGPRRVLTLLALVAVATLGTSALQAAGGDSAQALWRTSVSRGHSSSTTGLRTPVLDAPVAGCLLGRPKVTLTWTSPSDVRTGISIERQTGSSTTWTTVATLAASAVTFTDSGSLAGLTTYTYRVRHTTATWTGAVSSARSVNTLQASCVV